MTGETPDTPGADEAAAPQGDRSPEGQPVQHCPWCGESIGSFWGRRGTDGSHWCESCQSFFTVTRC